MKTMRTLSARNSCAKRKIFGAQTRIAPFKTILLVAGFLFVLLSPVTYAQGVGISEIAITPDASAVLELRSTTRGFLMPRNAAIGYTVAGLSFYNTSTNRINFYNGSTWIALPSATSETGTGAYVYATSPSLVTPNIGAATGASLSLSALTNQLVLGTTNTITFSATAPSTSRVITFPDPGAAANVIYDVSAQTISGAKTFSSLGTFNAGITSIGAAVNLNASSNFATNINTGTSTGIVSIGSTTGAAGITERVGTSNYSLDGVAGSTYSIGASTIAGTITIGGTAQTGNFILGQSSGTMNLNLGTGTGATTINLGTGATNSKTINIGTGAVANVLSIGSSTGAASMTIESGTGNFTLGNSANARTWNVGAGTAVQTVNMFNNAVPANTMNIGGAASALTIGARKNTIGIPYSANGDGVRFGTNRVTMNYPTAPTTGLNANTTATVAQILDAGLISFSPTANRTLTLPTAQGAAGLVQNLPGTPAIGDVFTFIVVNTSTTVTRLVTLVAGTGITLSTHAVPGLSSTMFFCRVTSVAPNAETITIY